MTNLCVMDQMLDMIDKTYAPLSVFKRIVKHLRILSISTKIENGRMVNDDKSFDLLAESVEHFRQKQVQ